MQFLEGEVDLFALGDSVKLIRPCLLKPLTNPVDSWISCLSPGVLNVVESQEKSRGVGFPCFLLNA